jgi:phosphate transport system ATP-binding protein
MILFDEPYAALGLIATARIEELNDARKIDSTITDVTHDMQQAARGSDDTAFMYLSGLIALDDTNKIFAAPAHNRTQNDITGRFG